MLTREIPQILQLDIAGNPNDWIKYDDAAKYYAKGLVAWSMQQGEVVINGGVSRMTGLRSSMALDTIIAIRGKVSSKQLAQMNRVPLNNRTLFRRDHHHCGYCGNEFRSKELSCDHIKPKAQGGENIWMNVITACAGCNKFKADMTPEQAGMELLFLPYIPNKAEWLILQNRDILADQMAFLMAQVPPDSRLHLL